jgi:hypothetical protein
LGGGGSRTPGRCGEEDSRAEKPLKKDERKEKIKKEKKEI